MGEPLVVVADAFPARVRGTLVRPTITLDRAPGPTFDVMLRTPDGRERRASAALEVSHVRGPLPPIAMIRLIDVAPEDVAPGTEIWSL